MKNYLPNILQTLILSLLLHQIQVKSQTMTGTVLTQPCNNNGQIGVTVTGLTPPISYTFSNWAAGVTIVHPGVNAVTDIASGLKAYQEYNWSNPNYWYVQASDGLNSAAMNVLITPPFSDSIKVYPGNCPSPSTIQATSFVGGTAPFSVVWTNTVTNISYPSNPAFVPNGTYSVIITDGAGCVVQSALGNSTLNITVNSISSIVANITGSPANCTNGTATVNASGGITPYTYLWSNSSTAQSLSGLSFGALTCIVTDNIGCQKTGNYYVSQAVNINFNSTITNATCLQNNGSILGFVSGGTAPYSFLWSNSSTVQSPTGLVGGQPYTVQITDANGCQGFGYTYVGVTTPISVTYTASASSCTAATGSAIITASGGLAPYSVIWNTFPSSSGTSITNKPAGAYNFTVTDANGCKQTGTAIIPTISTLSGNIANGNAICPATTGNVQAFVSGSNGPFTYLWNNSATTSSLTNVPLGNYSCLITDALGCSITKYGHVIQTSTISLGMSSSPASCKFTNDGTATANVVGGTAPYTYLWSNSQTSPTANNLLSGNYYAYVTDANGCHANSGYVNVSYNASNTSCYCTITGTVYGDANSNCVRNALEVGVAGVQIYVNPIGYAYTNSNGVYSFMVPAGTYTVTESVPTHYTLASCQSATSVVAVVLSPGCVTTVNFANTAIPVTPAHDLRIVTSSMNAPIPGSSYHKKIFVFNDGTFNEATAKLGYTDDGQLNYTSCTPWALTQQNSTGYPHWYSITSGFPSLNANSNSNSNIYYNVPTNIPMNTQVVSYDTISSNSPIATNWLTDNTPWNNVNTQYATVVSSYDPNFKEVSPQGTGPGGNISTKDSILTYIVHFQNEGTYFAQNVVVTDTIDKDLDITSLRPGYADHKYTVTIDENRVAKFTFKDIHLPWKSQYGDVLSSGLFTYSIKLKRHLAVGTKLTNNAAIYFDFNEPIITNTTLNTIESIALPNSVNELKSNSTSDMMLFPNPANTEFTILFNSTTSGSAIISIFDISGRQVSSNSFETQMGKNKYTSNSTTLQNGIYIVQLMNETTKLSTKLVITK